MTPAYLAALKKSWVAWRAELDAERPGEKVKIPYEKQPPGSPRWRGEGGANVWRPGQQHLDLAQAEALAAAIGGGTGLVLSTAHDVFVLDLDGCRDPRDGALAPWAQAVVDALPEAYADVSPSQQGVKLFFRAAKASDGRAKEKWPAKGPAAPGTTKAAGVEFFARGGYCTVTGAPLFPGRTDVGAKVPDERVAALLASLRPAGAVDPGTGVLVAARPALNEALSDDEVLEAFRVASPKLFQRWYVGGERTKDDASAEDFELAAALGRVVGGDGERIERLMRRSGIRRDKWGREDYMRATVGSVVTLPSDGPATDAPLPQLRTAGDISRDADAMTPPVAVVPRLAWQNRTTLLAGREKWAGKSTLLTAAAAAVTRGGTFLGLDCPPGDVLWLSADLEPGPDIVQRLARFGGDLERMAVDYPQGNYAARLAQLDARLQAKPWAWLVVDTVAHFALVEEASQAGGWIAALLPLRRLTQRWPRMAVTLVHHSPKGAQDEYRDSTAIGGAVDQIMIYRNPDRAGGGGRREMIGAGRVTGWRPFEADLVDGEPPYFALAQAAPPADLALREPVMAYVSAHRACSTRAIREALGGRTEDVGRAVQALAEAGAITDTHAPERPGEPRRGRYPAWAVAPAGGASF